MRHGLCIVALLLSACSTAVDRRLSDPGRVAPGPIPADRPQQDLTRALEERAANERVRDASGIPFFAGLSGFTPWTSHGPVNLSGITYSMLIDPENPNVFISGTYEGLWRSADAGASWTSVPAFDGLLVLSLARDPHNHNVIYAGTGLETTGADGIYRSVDRGITWQKLPGSKINGTILTIAVSPTASNVILVGTDNGIFRSADSAATWTPVIGSGTRDFSLTEARVAFDPTDGSRAAAIMLTPLPLGLNPHAYYSIDGGATWLAAAGFSDARGNGVSVAYAPSNPQRVYLGVATLDYEVDIWRSDDGGHSYTRVSHNVSVIGGGLLSNLYVSPTDPSFMVFGGIDLRYSTNGGATLTLITYTPAAGALVRFPHLDIHGIAPAPGFNGTTNRRVFTWTDGGVSRTDDITSGAWTPLFTNHQSTTYYSIDVSANGAIVGGMQDTGTSLTPPGGTITQNTSDGDISNVLFDPTNEGRFFASNFGTLSRSDDFRHSIADLLAGQPLQFAVPMVIDPNNSTRMFAACYDAARIDNIQGTPVVTVIRRQNGQHISAMAVQRGDSNVVYLVADSGDIYKSANALAASPAWNVVAHLDLFLPSRLFIDRDDPNILYLSDFYNGLFKSVNGGNAWSVVRGPSGVALPSAGVNDITEHPAHHDWLYAATSVGLYLSFDGGNHWYASPGPTVPTRMDIRSLKFRPGTNRLYLATYGRGIWSVDVPPTPEAIRRRSAHH